MTWDPRFSEVALVAPSQSHQVKHPQWPGTSLTLKLTASWEPWDAGSIPAPAQRVKDHALPLLRLGSQLCLGSDPGPGSSTGLWGSQNENGKSKQTQTDSPVCWEHFNPRRMEVAFLGLPWI